MLNRLVDFIINSLKALQFFAVIRHYERGVVLRLGKFSRILEPGFYFVIPFFVDEVIYDNVVPRTINMGPQSITTRDRIGMVVSAVVTYSIRDIRKFLLEIEGADQALVDSTYGIVSQLGASKDWEDLSASSLAEEAFPLVRKAAFKFGIEVVNLQFSDFTRSRSYRLWTGDPATIGLKGLLASTSGGLL